MAITSPKGMRDMLPDEAAYWEKFTSCARDIFGRYGYLSIDTPMAELTELFVRGIGEATDVVSKEMFEVLSGENLATLIGGGHVKSKSRMSLRPEGTAGVVRAVVQHDLVPQGAPPAKLMYAGPMFRAEQPQEGRYRQFRQVGIECLGADSPSIDAEGIIMCMRFFEHIGFEPADLVLLINSMGCETCRPVYRDKVREFGQAHASELCDRCKERLEKNPLRMFDCKNDACKKIMDDAPRISEHLCEDCLEHYSQVRDMLDSSGISYTQDSALVRGLDYYGRTVFEVQSTSHDGAQNAVGGGGRYDKLADEIRGDSKGTPLPGFGFALGYERCKEALIKKGMNLENARIVDVFIACASPELRLAAFELAQTCRDGGVVCELDHQSRSLKSQFKVADKLDAKFVIILGQDECAQNSVTVRNMSSHEEILLPTNELLSFLQENM